MRYFLPLLFITFLFLPRMNVSKVLVAPLKNNTKKQKMLLGIGNMEKHIHF